jgi:hypothetical protein
MTVTCVSCQLEYRNVKSGVGLMTMMADGPYQLYSADLLECPGCRHQVVRPGATPISEHWKPDFQAQCGEYNSRGHLYRSYRTEKEKPHADA